MNAELIKAEIDAAPKGAKSEIINRYAEMLKVSTDTVYRMIRSKYGPSKMVKREKKIDQKIIDEVARFKMMGMKLGLKERELSTELCVNHVEAKGYKVDCSVSTINRRLAESGFRMRKQIVRVEAAYSNQMHQMDFSRSKYFQVWKYDKKRSDYLLKIARQLTYKENENKLASWLVGITDAYSRIGLSRMYAASGESATIGIDFLNYVYGRAEDEHPLRYLPDILKTDNGAFIKNEDVKGMLNALEIKGELVIPYAKRGIQKQESAWKRLWRRYELDLAIKMGDGKTIHLNDYNELLEIHTINDLQADHPVREGTRVHNYLSSLTAHPPRTIDVDLSEVAFRVLVRIVRDDLTVSINNNKYECPAFANGKQVRIYRNRAGEFVGELIDEYRKPFILKPTKGYVEVGNFDNREHQTYRERIEQEMKRESRGQGAEGREQSADGVEIKYIPPREERFEPETKFTEALSDEVSVFSSVYEAKVYISKRLLKGESYGKYAEYFDELLSKTLERVHIDYLINSIYQSNVRMG